MRFSHHDMELSFDTSKNISAASRVLRACARFPRGGCGGFNNSMSTATYCPEDNKLRLYVGRVPRDEYLKLRADGWTSTPKQSCDFVATWTPDRRDTCLEYADLIEDEDQTPEERAADRAERFGEYRDKRTEEATGHADRFDAGPTVHGYQSAERGARAARRHDRIASRAVDAWSKAEYWTSRTSGVIRHALYKSAPGVRMGRIKTIEADLRRHVAHVAERRNIWEGWKKIAAIENADEQTAAALHFSGHVHQWGEYKHPRAEKLSEYYHNNKVSLYSLLDHVQDPITGAEACAFYFSDHGEPLDDNDWSTHYKLRLAYEKQMLAVQGGMLEQFEVLPGGKLGSKLIIKVSKSSVTKRATSCDILGPKVSGWTYKAANIPGTEFAAYKFDLERISPGMYTPPTPESLAELEAFNKARKANAPKANKPPLINPTNEDGERLQKLWNDRAQADHESRNTYSSEAARKVHSDEFKIQEILRISQARYSEVANGAYARAETSDICANGKEYRSFGGCYETEREAALLEQGNVIFQVRTTGGDGMYVARRVIILTDKPQKPLPVEFWDKLEDPQRTAITCKACGQSFPRADWEPENCETEGGARVLTCPNSECNKDQSAHPAHVLRGRDSHGLSYSVNG